jgi:putative membrane protein
MLLDILAILGWGILLLKYWLTGQLKLLIHPNYFSLVLATSIVLLLLAIFQIKQLLQPSSLKSSLFPARWGSGLLLLTAILALMINPTILTSQTALHRGIRESLPLTQTQVQHFHVNSKPEERSLIDWVRTFNAYPEPDAYIGQKAKIKGFVIHDTQLPPNYLLAARFIITCCAVDAYSVVIPVKLETTRDTYPSDTWISVEGEMIAETFSDSRKIVLKAHTIETIPTPSDPYDY